MLESDACINGDLEPSGVTTHEHAVRAALTRSPPRPRQAPNGRSVPAAGGQATLAASASNLYASSMSGSPGPRAAAE
jgi:hypothetical protein